MSGVGGKVVFVKPIPPGVGANDQDTAGGPQAFSGLRYPEERLGFGNHGQIAEDDILRVVPSDGYRQGHESVALVSK